MGSRGPYCRLFRKGIESRPRVLVNAGVLAKKRGSMGTPSVFETTEFRGFSRLARARIRPRRTPSYDVAVASTDRVLAEMIHHAAAARGYACLITDAPTRSDIAPLSGARASIVVLDLDHLELHTATAVKRIANPETLVIVVGSDAAEHTQLQAIRAGAIDFVSKPLSVAVLLAKIEQHIARSP